MSYFTFVCRKISFPCNGSPYMPLAHWGRVTHICVNKLAIIGSDNGLSPDRPSHYLNQWWNSVTWTFTNKFQWDFNQDSNIVFQEIAFDNVVCKMASILSRPEWVKSWNNYWHYVGCVVVATAQSFIHSTMSIYSSDFLETMNFLKY